MIAENSTQFINILSEIIKPPYEILNKLTKYQYQFLIGKEPTESETKEEPPRELDEKAEIIPIDEYLGRYEPKMRKITIFDKGIDNASRIIRCDPKYLKYIVRLHEWSHALIHIGLGENDRLKALDEDSYWEECLKQSNQIYVSIEAKLHEHLAQLLTYHSLNLLREDAKHKEAKEVINRIIETFLELNTRQPSEYVVDDYLGVPQDRVIQSVGMLKKVWLKGVFDAWNIIMKW